MKSLLLGLLVAICPLAAPAGGEVFVLSNSTPIYAEASYSAEILAEASYNDRLALLSPEEFDGFYYISYNFENNQITGYVPIEIVGEKADEQELVLSYNATLSNSADILSPTDDSVLCTLPKGVRVFLYEGYNQKADYLAVRFIHGGQLMIGRIRTEAVKPDGVNPALIVSITAIVALVTIIIILFGVTKKKRHSKLKT